MDLRAHLPLEDWGLALVAAVAERAQGELNTYNVILHVWSFTGPTGSTPYSHQTLLTLALHQEPQGQGLLFRFAKSPLPYPGCSLW